MKNETGYFRLGLFVLIGTALLIGGVVFFSSAAYSEDGLVVETVTMESAQGLEVGAPVKFRGVRIGHVRKIELAYVRYRDKVVGAEQNIGNAVILELGIKPEGLPEMSSKDRLTAFETAVQHGLRPRIASSSLTGPPYVELVFLNPLTNPPLALPWTPDEPYLPAGQSTFAQFVDSAQEIIESVKKANVGRVIGHINDLVLNLDKNLDDLQLAEIRKHAIALLDELRDSNKRIEDILSNPKIAQMISDLADTSSSLKDTVKSAEVKQFLKDLPDISARLKSTIDQVNALLNDENIKKALANLTQASAGAKEAMAEVRKLAASANLLLSSEQQDIAAIVRNLRTAAEDAAAVTEDAKANPSRLLFGEPPVRAKGDAK